MQARGIFLTVLSAVLYGLNPLFSKTINVGGCNSLTQTFARLAAGIVIFFILLVCSGSGSVREKLRLSRQELKDILICCIGYGLIGPLLFASYNYLASGLATTLHFVYPVLVVVACIAFRYERANRRKLVCCALCFAGILCFYTPGGDVSAYGVFLALASGVAWAYYIVHLNSSGLVTMAPFKLAFWLCVFSAVLVGGITLAMGEFVWPSTAFTRGALALYCCVSTAASLLFQLGNRFIGAQSASMLSTFEPLTSVVIGILVYHEVLTVRLGIGILRGAIRLRTGHAVTDPTSGFRAANRRVIELFARDYAQDYPEPESLVTALRSGARVCDVPASMRARQGGTSSIGDLGAVYYMMKVTLAVLLHTPHAKL